MPDYKVEPLRTRNKDGTLKSAGARWDEHAAGTVGFLSLVAVILVLGGGLATLIGLLAGSGVFLVGLAALALGGFFFWSASQMATRSRSLTFDDEGRMSAPQGLPYYPNVFSVGGNHSEVTSIEVTGKTYSNPNPENSWQQKAVNVALLFSGGKTVYVARDLSVELARNVAVQLTQALATMRKPAAGRESAARDDDLIE